MSSSSIAPTAAQPSRTGQLSRRTITAARSQTSPMLLFAISYVCHASSQLSAAPRIARRLPTHLALVSITDSSARRTCSFDFAMIMSATAQGSIPLAQGNTSTDTESRIGEAPQQSSAMLSARRSCSRQPAAAISASRVVLHVRRLSTTCQ